MPETISPTPAAPPLHDISDEESIAIFDPERVADDQAHWIQMDREYAVSVEESR